MSGHICQMDRGQISWVTSASYEIWVTYVWRGNWIFAVLSWFGTPLRLLLFPASKKVPHKATEKLRRLGRVNSVHASSIMLICHHNLLVFLAILLRVVQAGSSDSLNSTDGDRLVLSFEAVANLIWKSAHAIFLPQFGTCTANHQKKPLIFISTSWLMMWAHERWRQAEN